MTLSEELEKARDYAVIFALVKRAVKRTLGEHRVGLMLYLGNLPRNVGAFHPIGTNEIILNRRLIEAERCEKRRKTHVFTVLLHEYLHALGYVDERRVRGLAYKVCVENFTRDHPVVDASITGPWTDLSEEEFDDLSGALNLELVKNFERFDGRYIV
jgi:hypothetical protein